MTLVTNSQPEPLARCDWSQQNLPATSLDDSDHSAVTTSKRSKKKILSLTINLEEIIGITQFNPKID